MRATGVWLSMLVFAGTSILSADDSLARLAPPNPLAVLGVSNLGKVIEGVAECPRLQEFYKSAAGKQILQDGNLRKVLAGSKVLEAQVGMPPHDLIRVLLGNEVLIAIYPPAEGAEPEFVMISKVTDQEGFAKLRERVDPLIELANDQIERSEIEGGFVLKARDGNQLAYCNNHLITSKSSRQIDHVLARLRQRDEGPRADTLATTSAWQQSQRVWKTPPLASLFVDVKTIRDLIHRPLFPEKFDNPVASLLFGGVAKLADDAPWIGVGLEVGEKDLKLGFHVPGLPASLDESHRALFAADESKGISIPTLKGRVAGFGLSRNILEWYRNRETLLVDRLMPEFDKFETGLANFFPGKDFAKDLLPNLTGRVSLLAVSQDFAHLPSKPGIRLPAFGVCVELTKPEEGANLFRVLFQTIVSISNLEASKQGRQPWVLDSETYRDVTISYAKYLQKPEGDTLPVVYNFQPASVLVGNQFLMATSTALCRNFIDSQRDKSQETPAERNAGSIRFSLSPSVGASVLEDNRQMLEAQSIRNGKSSDQAKTEVDLLLAVLRELTELRLDESVSAGGVTWTLQGGVKP